MEYDVTVLSSAIGEFLGSMTDRFPDCFFTHRIYKILLTSINGKYEICRPLIQWWCGFFDDFCKDLFGVRRLHQILTYTVNNCKSCGVIWRFYAQMWCFQDGAFANVGISHLRSCFFNKWARFLWFLRTLLLKKYRVDVQTEDVCCPRKPKNGARFRPFRLCFNENYSVKSVIINLLP